MLCPTFANNNISPVSEPEITVLMKFYSTHLSQDTLILAKQRKNTSTYEKEKEKRKGEKIELGCDVQKTAS